jgi:hypothetical protein
MKKKSLENMYQQLKNATEKAATQDKAQSHELVQTMTGTS